MRQRPSSVTIKFCKWQVLSMEVDRLSRSSRKKFRTEWRKVNKKSRNIRRISRLSLTIVSSLNFHTRKWPKSTNPNTKHSSLLIFPYPKELPHRKFPLSNFPVFVFSLNTCPCISCKRSKKFSISTVSHSWGK